MSKSTKRQQRCDRATKEVPEASLKQRTRTPSVEKSHCRAPVSLQDHRPALSQVEAQSDRALTAGRHDVMLESRRRITVLQQSPYAAKLCCDDLERDIDNYFNNLPPDDILDLAERGTYEACHIAGGPIWPILT